MSDSTSLLLVDVQGTIVKDLRDRGFVRLAAPDMLRLLGDEACARWESFGALWADLGHDRYMADGGRYRRRRYAAFTYRGERLTRKPHQPHFQSRDYNQLNGDVQRWFEPVRVETEEHPITQAILALSNAIFSAVDKGTPRSGWGLEFHQFRIETTPGHVGRPTPEGLHRDGVDWVFVMLLCRQNVRDGLTMIGEPDGTKIGSFLLSEPGDAVLLDDRRILHGVTEIHAVDPALPAYRDVLVVTFVRE